MLRAAQEALVRKHGSRTRHDGSARTQRGMLNFNLPKRSYGPRTGGFGRPTQHERGIVRNGSNTFLGTSPKKRTSA